MRLDALRDEASAAVGTKPATSAATAASPQLPDGNSRALPEQ
jgi:hypothetical protein